MTSKRFIFEVDPRLLERAKRQAKRRDTTLAQVCRAALREFVAVPDDTDVAALRVITELDRELGKVERGEGESGG